MPNKSAKYGIKIWVTCDVTTSYAWKMQIYTGKSPGSPAEVNQGKRVVLDMTDGLQGNTVTCDNFFTSYALAEEILKRKMALVGTILKNKPELPPQLLSQRRTQRCEGRMCCSLAPSTGTQPSTTIITDYNHCKGGVDNLDKVVATYSCRRRTCRWPVVLFYNLVDVSTYKSFVLWSAVEPSWNQGKAFRRRLFLEELGKMPVMPHVSRRQGIPRQPSTSTMVEDQQQEVPNTKKRKVASTCRKCGKVICKDHTFTYCSSCRK